MCQMSKTDHPTFSTPLLIFLSEVDFVEFAFFVFALFDEVAVAVNVDVEIFVEFDDAFQCPRLLLDGTVRNVEVIRQLHIMLFDVCGFVLVEAFDNVRLPHHVAIKVLCAERIVLLKELYGLVQQVGLVGLGNLEMFRQIFFDESLG